MWYSNGTFKYKIDILENKDHESTYVSKDDSVEIWDLQLKILIKKKKEKSIKKEIEKHQQFSVTGKENKERLWHLRYGHLGEKSLKKLAGKGL